MNQLPPGPTFQQQPIPISTFPVCALPLLMQNVISYLQDGGKIPTELVVNPVLAAVSLACQPHIEVLNPYTNMEEHCALNILTLAHSGMGKSTINKQVMKPFDTFRAELAKEYLAKLSTYKGDYAVWKTKHKALDSKLHQAVKKGNCADEAQTELKAHASIEPIKPLLPTLVYNDTSLTALIDGLNEYPYAGLISDEASSFFDHRLKDNLAFFNKAWDGDIYEHKRSNREPLSFKPTLMVSLLLQPPLFLDYMKKDGDKALESGFLFRFLFTNIQPSSNYRSLVMSHRYCSNTSTRDETALNCFHTQINKLLIKQKKEIYSRRTEKKTLKLSSVAENYWEQQRAIWIEQTMPGKAWYYINPMVLKANTNTLRIAGLIHHFSSQDVDIISLETIERASTIMEWYLNHFASWFYQFTDEYKFQQDVYELHQWIYQRFMSNCCIPFKKNEVIKYGPSKFRRSDKLEPLLNSIIATGSIVYAQLNPHSAVYITFLMGNGYYAPIIEYPTGKQFPTQQEPKQLN
ncbi:DUF3987 domain-containing protein [Yersinia vastinensis]|uniref:DUF3987 domain-containing protein n=1 Tax=Yersinia vastinensis TaxID=2890318 RepID=UPI0011A5D307|nr:DUF3987 domain-containing protein [Yersinia vastinensis]